MLYYGYDVNLIDVPNEISLTFAIAGCQLNCKGCFWQSLPNESGTILDLEIYQTLLVKYQSYVSCILFYGGEWCANELIEMLLIAHEHGYKTCLYTGLKKIDNEILACLDYLKTGAYSENLGGLNSPSTNQKFVDVTNNRDLTHLFWRNRCYS